MIKRTTRQHYSFLLRLWREGSAGALRASLENVQDSNTVRFEEAAQAWTYLLDYMNPPPPSEESVSDFPSDSGQARA